MSQKTGVNLSSKFSKIRQKIRKGLTEEAITILNTLQETVNTNREAMKGEIEARTRRVTIPQKDWKLEVVDAEGSTHRLTVSPKEGRVTLKVSKKASDTVREHLFDIAQLALDDDEPYDITLRGKIKFHKGYYETQLVSESKLFKKNYKLKEKSVEQ